MKVIHIACIALLIVIFVNDVYAHPPNEVELTFEEETAILTVGVSHMVGKPAKHYIDKVVVELNDEEIIVQRFIIQGSDAKQEANYIIPGVKAGDIISVTAYCNISGKKNKILQIEKPQDEKKQH